MVVVIDEQDRVVYERRHPNDLGAILSALSPYAETLEGIAVVKLAYSQNPVVARPLLSL